MRKIGENPFRLDSPRPTIRFRDYAYNELRYKALAQSRPQEAAELLAMAQAVVDEKYRTYEEMAGWAPGRFHPAPISGSAGAPASA
jgi:pyruvate-ferredoxin/flavodoxin oxidoreductase